MYQNGWGVPRSHAEAAKWYLLSKQGSSFIKKIFPLNSKAPLGMSDQFFSSEDIKILKDNLLETSIDFTRHRISCDPNSLFGDTTFMTPELYKTFLSLETNLEKVREAVDIVNAIQDPGFLITAVTPADSFKEAIEEPEENPFFSYDEYQGEKYLSVGYKNYASVKRLLPLLTDLFQNGEFNQLKLELEEVIKPYRKARKNLQAELIQISCQKIGLPINTDADVFERKKQAIETLEQVYLTHLQQDLSTLKDAENVLKDFIKLGLGKRNQEFLEEYPQLKK